jgi:hypothetical protein
VRIWITCLALLCVLPLLGGVSAVAQDDTAPEIEQGELPADELIYDEAAPAEEPVEEIERIPSADPAPDAPAIPSIDEVIESKNRQGTVRDYIPLDLEFRVGLIGSFEEEVETYDGGRTTNTKSPLILLDPRNGAIKVHARNFPAKVVANSENGVWVVGIAPSAAVEGTSGSPSRQAAVTLNMSTGEIKLITEFPVHSRFQAVFLENEKDMLLYCVNEPGAVNQLIRYNLETRVGEPMPAEGNRFYIYGLKENQGRETGIWVQDPRSIEKYPVVSLLDLSGGSQLDRVEFPGTNEVYSQPDGSTLLASIVEKSEASLGYYETETRDFHQINNLVFTRPEIKWTHKSDAVIVKETTATKDRFLWVDVASGKAKELFAAHFTIGQWDISPNDDALVFIVNSKTNPVLFVLPLEEGAQTINRIRLRDMTGVTWLGCLNTPAGASSGGGKSKGPMKWLDKLIPKF